MGSEKQGSFKTERSYTGQNRLRQLLRGVIDRISGEQHRQLLLAEEEKQLQREKELIQIKELTNSLKQKADILLNFGSLDRFNRLTYYGDGDLAYIRAVRSYPGYSNFNLSLTIRKIDEGIEIIPEGYKNATKIFIENKTKKVSHYFSNDISNERMIELLSSINDILDVHIQLESSSADEIEPLTFDVIIPKTNSYYSRPDAIQRVIQHLHNFDQSADLVSTGEEGRYKLKVGDESKTYILRGILQNYGFEV